MQTSVKHTALITALAARTTLLQKMQRLTVEQKNPPHFRTFVAVGREMTKDELDTIEAIATEHLLDCNPFRAGGKVSTITFVDMDERREDR